jgi:uncharacterized phiE125 gp8 family phage protein
VALPTLADLKAYQRIETTAEDALLSTLLLRAQAMLEQWVDVPIVPEVREVVDRTEGPARALVFPARPIADVSVVDVDGATIDPTLYTVDSGAGVIYGREGYRFVRGPYTITAAVGLALRNDYGRLEPLLSQAILDLAADLYQRRTPGAQTETGSGTTISWDVSRETVARVLKDLRLLKLAVAG